jgi:hypothetical protein
MAPEKRGSVDDPCWRTILHGQKTGSPAPTRQWLQDPSSDMGQPLRRRIPPGGWSLGSEFNRLTGRVSASVASRVLPVRTWPCCKLLYISRYRRPVLFVDCSALNRPAVHMLALDKVIPLLSSICTSPRVASPELATWRAFALQDSSPTAR